MIETERLRLAPLRRDHAELCFEPLQASELYEHVPDRAPESLEALRERFEFLELGMSPTGTEHWLNWIALDRETDELVGTFQASVRPGREAELAYQVLPGRWRRGYAREMTSRLLEHLAQNYEFPRFVAVTAITNLASIALLEALDFTVETRFETGDVRFVLEARTRT